VTEYTPTTDEVRREYAAGRGRMGLAIDLDTHSDFNRWLAAHDAQVQRAARIAGLREAALIAKVRQIDMEQCHKPDNCNVIARGAYLTCEDIMARVEDVEGGVYD